MMLWQDSSEDNLDELLVEFTFPLQNNANYPCSDLQDTPNVQCEAIFRYKFFASGLFLKFNLNACKLDFSKLYIYICI